MTNAQRLERHPVRGADGQIRIDVGAWSIDQVDSDWPWSWNKTLHYVSEEPGPARPSRGDRTTTRRSRGGEVRPASQSSWSRYRAGRPAPTSSRAPSARLIGAPDPPA